MVALNCVYADLVVLLLKNVAPIGELALYITSHANKLSPPTALNEYHPENVA